MSIQIRRAVKEDCPRIMDLIRELALYEKAPEEVTATAQQLATSGFGPNPVWWGFVAEVDGVVEAFALYYIRYSTWKGPRMYLEDILVTEKLRGRGVGKMLFDRLITEARDRKFNGIVWQVLDWNDPAINFYTKYYNAKIDKGWYNCSIEI